jgi:hypothetical protein
MKGIVFTQFLEMVEERYSPAIADRILLAAQLPSGGAYTAVGTYDHGEIWSLVCELSKVIDVPVPDLFRAYGEYLFGHFVAAYPHCLGSAASAFDVLQGLDSMIHREVCRLYPDAELPRFDVIERTPHQMTLIYQSARHFADLAEGLIRACGRHFGQTLALTRETLAAEGGSRVRFTLALQ